MKTPVLLISINLAATSIILQPAQATEVASDKTGWLKASLVQLSELRLDNNNGYAQQPPDAKSLSAYTPDGNEYASNRNFVRKRNPKTTLIAQRPVMAVVPSHKLTGEISAYVKAQESSYINAPAPAQTLNRSARRPAASISKNNKVNPSNRPRGSNISRDVPIRSLGEQLLFEKNRCRHNGCAQAALIGRPDWQKQRVGSHIGPVDQLAQPDPQQHKSLSSQSGTPLSSLSMPIDNQSALHEAFPTRLPSHRLPDTDFEDIVIPDGTSSSRVGPPPFPLSLLPEHQLRQLIRSGCVRNSIKTSPSSFGSWRGTSQSLPFAGFHSYLHSRNPSSNGCLPYNSRIAHTPVKHVNHSFKMIDTHRPVRKVSANPLRVAAYPVYHSSFQASSY